MLHQTKFMALLALALDPAASMSVSNLKQALMEIHDVVVALQNTATTTSQFLEEKGMYSDDEVPDPFYRGILMKIQLMIVIKTWTTTTVTMSDPHEHHIQPAKLSDAM